MISRLKAIIFDMDGVIVNTEPIHFALEKELFKELNVNVPDELHHSFLGVSEKDMWKYLINEKYLEGNIEELISWHNNKFLEKLKSLKEIPVMDGIIQLLHASRRSGLVTILASSSSRLVIDNILAITGLNSYFEFIFSAHEVKKSKPHPDIFLYALEKTGINPNECVVIEDSTNGILAAKRAGLKVIAFSYQDARVVDQSMADKKIKHFSEIDIHDIDNMLNIK